MKNIFKESALAINLTAICCEKSMRYGRETLGILSDLLRKLELAAEIRRVDDNIRICFQNWSQVKHFCLISAVLSDALGPFFFNPLFPIVVPARLAMIQKAEG